MSHTNPKATRVRREDLMSTRQPRPALRRQGTRAAAVAAAIREG